MKLTEITKEGFSAKVGLFSKAKYRWSGVERIHAVKIDKVTYEEIFIVMSVSGEDVVEVGELDKLFDKFLKSMYENFSEIDRAWRAYVEAAAPGVYLNIWHR